jgi:hypothetical protein
MGTGRLYFDICGKGKSQKSQNIHPKFSSCRVVCGVRGLFWARVSSSGEASFLFAIIIIGPQWAPPPPHPAPLSTQHTSALQDKFSPLIASHSHFHSIFHFHRPRSSHLASRCSLFSVVNERREKSESVSCGSKQSYRSLINTI